MPATEYDFIINCARDWTPAIDVTRPNANTRDPEPYAGISDVELRIVAANDSDFAIDDTLKQDASEATGAAGTIYATFDVADLQAHLLPTYEWKEVFLKAYKDGELVGEAMRCLVVRNRLA